MRQFLRGSAINSRTVLTAGCPEPARPGQPCETFRLCLKQVAEDGQRAKKSINRRMGPAAMDRRDKRKS